MSHYPHLTKKIDRAFHGMINVPIDMFQLATELFNHQLITGLHEVKKKENIKQIAETTKTL